MAKLRLCVLISGSGTNLQALISARDSGRLDIEIVHVISNVAGVAGLDKARAAGIPSSILRQASFDSRDDFDRALALLMETGAPQLFVFAGFMRIVGAPVLERFAGKMINLHPSLLPLYPGLNTYQRALDAGDSQYGASIHFLTEALDSGPVISQVKLLVEKFDDAFSMQNRLAPYEHKLVVATVELFVLHRVECRKSRVLIDVKPIVSPAVLGNDGKLRC